MKKTGLAALVAGATLLAVTLTGCSAKTDTTSSSATPSTSVSATPSSTGKVTPPPVEPVQVDPAKEQTAKTQVGRIVLFLVSDPAKWDGSASDSKVGTFNPSIQVNGKPTIPSFMPQAVGTSKVTLTSAGKSYTIAVTVTK
jgi:PBP1b-binding outer membrane lipoprotein LpoB